MKWKKHKKELWVVLGYLFGFLALLLVGYLSTMHSSSPKWLTDQALAIRCTLCGGLGGAIYLFRAVYLRCCVFDDWDGGWQPWYFIRPITSLLCGLVAFVFLSAGLIVLDGDRSNEAGEYGFYALCILAGLNVDKFLVRIEEIGKAVFGIEQSRASKGSVKGSDNEES